MDEEQYENALAFARAHGRGPGSFELTRDPDGFVILGDDVASGPPQEELDAHLHGLGPWRKGPFRLFGREVHAHWKSDRKWQHVLGYLGDVRGLTIADVGCNNGYYMFRLLEHEPGRVIGFDPAENFERQFCFLHAILPDERLEFRREGWQSLADRPGEFDLILAMGILYHHTDPMAMLRVMHGALKKGGRLLIESMAIAGEDSMSLVPAGKYAGARGIWFVPTIACMENWLRRAGYRDIRVHAKYRDVAEQERAEFADLPSLSEFMDPDDPERTVEGYPAPLRVHLSARR